MPADTDEGDLRVTDEIVIRRHELVERFDPSGGPGGQHANRTSTRVELSFDLGSSTSIPAEIKRRALERLADRFTDGVVTVTSADTRSQWRNRRIARTRLVDLLAGAVTAPPPPRRPTRPTTASRRQRLDQKRLRAEVKRLRRRPEAE
jgi:ribosome-associated protein